MYGWQQLANSFLLPHGQGDWELTAGVFDGILRPFSVFCAPVFDGGQFSLSQAPDTSFPAIDE